MHIRVSSVPVDTTGLKKECLEKSGADRFLHKQPAKKGPFKWMNNGIKMHCWLFPDCIKKHGVYRMSKWLRWQNFFWSWNL